MKACLLPPLVCSAPRCPRECIAASATLPRWTGLRSGAARCGWSTMSMRPAG